MRLPSKSRPIVIVFLSANITACSDILAVLGNIFATKFGANEPENIQRNLHFSSFASF